MKMTLEHTAIIFKSLDIGRERLQKWLRIAEALGAEMIYPTIETDSYGQFIQIKFYALSVVDESQLLPCERIEEKKQLLSSNYYSELSD